MSLSLNPIIPVRAMDPALNFEDNRYYSVTTGAETVSYKPIISTSYSNSSISFSCPPPSPLIAIHNKVYLSVPMLIHFHSNAQNDAGGDLPDRFLLQSGKGALRAFALENIIQTATARINNNTNNVSYSDIIPYLVRYNTNFHELEYEYSCAPSYLDRSCIYENLVADAVSPFASYGQIGYGQPRGAFPLVNCYNAQVPAATAGDAYIQCVITSPIWISPFGFGQNSDNKNALIGVSTMDFIFTLANLERVWSSVLGADSNANPPGVNAGVGADGLAGLPGNPYSSITVSIGQPAMLFRYLSPKLLQSIPRSLTYSYTILDRYPSTDLEIAPLTTSEFTSNNIQLNTIPRRVYIFARRSNSSRDGGNGNQRPYVRSWPPTAATSVTLNALSAKINTTDTFLPITRLEVNYNNNSGLLSSATSYDLWNISKKNGVNISWPEWCGSPVTFLPNPPPNDIGAPNYSAPGIPMYFNNAAAGAQSEGFGVSRDYNIGSIVALDWGIDVGLNDIHAPDQIFNSQLYIRASFHNPTRDAIVATMYVITCTSGTLTIENLQAIVNIGVLSKEDVVNARQQEGIVYSSKHSIYGGDLASSLKKFGKQAASAVKSAIPYVKKGVEGVTKAAQVAGQAVDSVEGLAGLVGMGYHGGVNSGGAYAGGRRITRAELQQRLGMN